MYLNKDGFALPSATLLSLVALCYCYKWCVHHQTSISADHKSSTKDFVWQPSWAHRNHLLHLPHSGKWHCKGLALSAIPVKCTHVEILSTTSGFCQHCRYFPHNRPVSCVSPLALALCSNQVHTHFPWTVAQHGRVLHTLLSRL